MNLKDKITVFENFPKEGVSFKDINPVIRDSEAFRYCIDEFYKVTKAMDANIIVIPESRGYIFGSALAYRIGAGLVPIRKPGKLPGKIVSQKYSLEYGTNEIQIQYNAIKPGDRVVIIDDLLATGGTMSAAIDLVENLGGEVCAALCVVELTELGGRKLLKDYIVKTLVQYDK